MTRPRFWRGIYLILTGILLYNLLPLQAQAVNSPAALSPSNTALSSTPSPSQVKASLVGQHKVLVDGQDQATLKNLASNGATLLADYGSFSLWSVSDTIQKQAANQRGVQVRDDLDEITLRNGVINTRLSSVPAVPTNLRQSKVAANQLWMIQFAGPVKDEWVQNLNKLGIQLVSYIPANAYVIWGDGAALTALEQQAATDPVIQWTGPYHPAYRLHPNLQSGVEKKQLLDSQLVDVTVEFFSNSADVKTSVKNLLGLAGKIYRQPWNYGGLTDVSLQVPAGKLVEISGWPDVFNVEPWSAPQKRDEVQDQIVAGNLTTNAGLTVPVAPGYLAWLQSKGFTATPSD
ncbi:MAG TPA: hypothetical protein VH186_02240, partial [Chloroflexia bacterium]|nr:hypothetical protein [Chloroflexia bacterium]